MLGRILDRWASGRQAKEIQFFLNGLRAADADEIGLIVASSADWRHKLIETGFDPLLPAVCLAKDSTITFQISRTIELLQKAGQQHYCAGLMVWAHTLRAMTRPELRLYGRQMWAELARGFPYAPASAFNAKMLFGMEFRLSGYDRFPDGLTPEPK